MSIKKIAKAFHNNKLDIGCIHSRTLQITKEGISRNLIYICPFFTPRLEFFWLMLEFFWLMLEIFLSQTCGVFRRLEFFGTKIIVFLTPD